MTQRALYGIVAEFPTPTPIVAAAQELHRGGLRFIDAYTPYPIEELNEMLGPRHRWGIPLVTLVGALLGAISSTFVQYWAATIDYPLNIGGRPLNSWPAFTVSSFELTLLFAIAGAFVAFLAASRLPLLYHPVFAAADFARASQDRFFLSVRASDPHFDAASVRAILERYGAAPIDEVLA
jgi:hypothetical protein